MFNFKPFFHKPKFDSAKDSGIDFENMHEEMMHNMCEFTEKNEITWNAGLNL
jgi:hypothetical protein